MDILNGYHLIYSPYMETQLYLQERYGITFKNNIYRKNEIVLRKEIKMFLLNYIKDDLQTFDKL